MHNEELNDLYSSPNIVRVTKSRRMRWAGHVARMGEERGVYRVLVGKPEGMLLFSLLATSIFPSTSLLLGPLLQQAIPSFLCVWLIITFLPPLLIFSL